MSPLLKYHQAQENCKHQFGSETSGRLVEPMSIEIGNALLKEANRHSIYIRIVSSLRIFSFGTFNSFQAGLGRNQVYGAFCYAQMVQTSLNQFS